MPVNVTPSTDKPSHHISLTDGSTTIGLIAVDSAGKENHRAINRNPIQRTTLKLSQGSTQYSDFSEPFTPITQSDWSGGLGQEDFERDRTRFYTSNRLNTWMSGRITLGPEETYGTGFRDADSAEMPNAQGIVGLNSDDNKRYYANKFAASATYSADKVYIPLRRIGSPGTLTVELTTDSGGDPDTVLETVTKTTSDLSDKDIWQWIEFDWGGTQALTSGTSYWIKIYGAASDSETNTWKVAATNNAGAGKSSTNNSTWASDKDIYFRVVDTDDDRESLFYEYKGSMYFVTKPTDNSAAQIWINGNRGAADDNSGDLTKLNDATQSWTTDEWKDSVVVIVDGPGNDEPINFRVISSNTGTALTVSPAFNTTHTTATDYVIIGADSFIERTGHGLTVPALDVLTSKEVTYYTQGESVNMRRHREYNNAGTWTITDYAADGTNKATFLQQVEDPVDGQQVWKANRPGTGDQSVARGNSQAWGTDITFGTAIPVGDRDDKITGLERYGSPENLWVMKQGSVWALQNDIPDQIPLREMGSVRSEKNGRAHLVHGVYLYFSLLHSLQRYFRNNLDDVGPSRDAGLPADHQGPIVDMVGYPGMFFAAIDGGTANYSSILVYNQLGWHNVYTSPVKGKRIRNIYIQVIPGVTLDRLWFSEGTDVAWLGLPSDTLDSSKDSNSRFTAQGWLVTSWFYANLQDVRKIWKSLTLFEENHAGAGPLIQVHYQLDDSDDTDAWTGLPLFEDVFDESPTEEKKFGSTYTINGRRVRLRLIFNANRSSDTGNTKTGKLKASVIDSLPVVATRYSYTTTFRAFDRGKDLNGDDETYALVETLMAQLETWANSTTVLTMRSVNSNDDNKYIKLEAPSSQPGTTLSPGDIEQHIGNATLVEIDDV